MTARASLDASLAYRTYQAITALSGPVLRRLLKRRLARGKEDPARIAERFGEPAQPRPEGPLVWFHAASVGESVTLLPLLDLLLATDPELHILVTTGTVTSAELMKDRLPNRALHQFVPVDHPAYCAAFVAHWRPDLAVMIESELWPNLIAAADRSQIPLALINARLSEKSYSNWRRARGFATALLESFQLVLAQDTRSADRLNALARVNAKCLGNMKYDAPALPVDRGRQAGLSAQIGGRAVWIAASTHEGEEEIVADIHAELMAARRDLLLILVPRHPERGDEIAALLRGHGFGVAQRSRGDALMDTHQVYLADTLGEIGLFYSLSRVAFIGGSFVPVGGHNPFEPLRFGAVPLTGPLTANFDDAMRDLVDADAAVQVATASDLASEISSLLGSEERCARYKTAGQAFLDSVQDIAPNVLAELLPLIKPDQSTSEGSGHA